MQDTKINANMTFDTDNYVWFLSTSVNIEHRDKVEKMRAANEKIDKATQILAQEHLGVGFLVHKRIVAAIENIWAVGSGCILLHTKGSIEIFVLNSYAPTAEAPDHVKDDFYDTLSQQFASLPGDCFKVMIGDFNAKVAQKDDLMNGFGGSSF